MKGRTLVARNLRRLRAERGISQERLAADAAVNRTYMSDIERERGNPTIDILDRLAGVLGVEIKEFFEVPAKGTPKPLGLRTERPAKKR